MQHICDGDILAWSLDEDTLEEKLSQASYISKVTLGFQRQGDLAAVRNLRQLLL